MKFVIATIEEDNETQSYRVYLTDVLMYAGQGKAIKKRWAETLKPTRPDFDAEKVVDDLIARLGGE